MANIWRKCSSCKNDILTGGRYYECSVSTCTSKRTGYVFCSVPCFERHLPGARHKDAYAIEEFAPKSGGPNPTPQAAPKPVTAQSGQRRIVSSKPSPSQSSASYGQANNNEVLIVASKLKKYIQDRGDMNTSQSVMNRLSDMVRREADRAIDNARADGRKTVMDRDFK